MHRVNQFVAHIRARVEPDEAVLAARILPSGGVALFSAMPVPDQRHGLDVAHRLMAAGVDAADVLGAALLHDAAKGHRMRLAHRVGGVLLEAASPRLLARLARDDPRCRPRWHWPPAVRRAWLCSSRGAPMGRMRCCSVR